MGSRPLSDTFYHLLFTCCCVKGEGSRRGCWNAESASAAGRTSRVQTETRGSSCSSQRFFKPIKDEVESCLCRFHMFSCELESQDHSSIFRFDTTAPPVELLWQHASLTPVTNLYNIKKPERVGNMWLADSTASRSASARCCSLITHVFHSRFTFMLKLHISCLSHESVCAQNMKHEARGRREEIRAQRDVFRCPTSSHKPKVSVWRRSERRKGRRSSSPNPHRHPAGSRLLSTTTESEHVRSASSVHAEPCTPTCWVSEDGVVVNDTVSLLPRHSNEELSETPAEACRFTLRLAGGTEGRCFMIFLAANLQLLVITCIVNSYVMVLKAEWAGFS